VLFRSRYGLAADVVPTFLLLQTWHKEQEHSQNQRIKYLSGAFRSHAKGCVGLDLYDPCFDTRCRALVPHGPPASEPIVLMQL